MNTAWRTAAAALSTLARWRESLIVDYTVTANAFSVLLERDWEESALVGATVDVAYRPYSAEELHRIARRLSDAHQDESQRRVGVRRRLEHVEHFVADQIARAQARSAMSTRSPVAEERLIDVLQRVLHHAREAGAD